MRILHRGGGTKEDAAREVQEREEIYPELSMFGTLPAYGLYVRHVRGLTLRDVTVGTMTDDARPPIVLQDAQDVTLDHVDTTRAAGVPFAVFRDIADLVVRGSRGIADTRLTKAEKGEIAK